MKKRIRVTVLVCLALVSFHCSEESTDSPDLIPDAVEEDSVPSPSSDGSTSEEGGTPLFGASESGEDESGPGPEPFNCEESSLNCACESNADCLSGACVEKEGGLVCTVACGEECPEGTACEAFQGAEVEALLVCLPQFTDLCRPCVSHEECQVGLSDNRRCVSYGDAGSFCGTPCTTSADCPSDYECELGSGHTPDQCVRIDLSCPCSSQFTQDEASTLCYLSNESGSCEGLRGCFGKHLSVCDAATPTVEVCNGVDDDCDGTTDDVSPADCVAEGPAGPCSGVLVCEDGVQSCKTATLKSELCDGIDNNCDGLIDEGYPDLDGDQIANCLDPDIDGDGVPNPEDCAPENPLIFPGAKEVCNGVDDDCDLLVDTAGSVGCITGYPDEDDDGYGAIVGAVCLCDLAGTGLVIPGGDCADLEPEINPGMDEICDDQDNNCDGLKDEGCDDDGDGYCDLEMEVASPLPSVCPNGGGDCADMLSWKHPNSLEICDGSDNNCDFKVDEGCDDDGDGYCDAGMFSFTWGTVTCPNAGGDCDDENAAVHPGKLDHPDMGFEDINCDGVDGTIPYAVFVDSKAGNDEGPGTQGSPVKSISKGIERAKYLGISQVLVGKGYYPEQIDMEPGIGVFGGYLPMQDWARSETGQTTISWLGEEEDKVIAVSAISIQPKTKLQLMKIIAGNCLTGNCSTYGVYARNASGLEVEGCKIFSGDGGDGADGWNGSKGLSGTAGGYGEKGSDGSTKGGFGGTGGVKLCAANGGAGGKGGYNDNGGFPGNDGDLNGGQGGAGAKSGNACNKKGEQGTAGQVGSDGDFGLGGSGGSVVSSYWVTAAGSDGGPGEAGGGGGGGSGGCGGSPGHGAKGGGGSFGIFLHNSSPDIGSTSIDTGSGGHGGVGGNGGAGGSPGAGGIGGGGPDDGGSGATGGPGGAGGLAGNGGGGAGGPSIGIFLSGSSAPVIELNTMSFDIGAAGYGGMGGTEGWPFPGVGSAGLSKAID